MLNLSSAAGHLGIARHPLLAFQMGGGWGSPNRLAIELGPLHPSQREFLPAR